MSLRKRNWPQSAAHSAPTLAAILAALCVSIVPTQANATGVQSLGVVPSGQLLAGLGFTVDPESEWEFESAATAGATHVRFQCGWSVTEIQTPPPQNRAESTPYVLPSACQSGFTYSRKYGMHPTVIAAFGPPFHAILSVSVPKGAAAGSLTIGVQFASGVGGDTIASLGSFYDNIIAANGAQITRRNSYAGGLIVGFQQTDSTHATLKLASALTSSLPANTTTLYIINQATHPPAATWSPSDYSIQAYANYAHFLAESMANAGLEGEVELWNEPPWSEDPWDNKADFYDTFPGAVKPGPQAQNLPNFGFVAALMNQTPISGVTYIWGGTNKSGDNSVFNARMLANTGVSFKQPATTVTIESFHPYGNTPEDEIWSEPCLKATINPYPQAPGLYHHCNLVSTSGSNILEAEQLSLIQKSRNSSWGIAHNITETGFQENLSDTVHLTRFTMRQFLGFEAAGITPIEFYRLYDTTVGQFGFTSPTTKQPLPVYIALEDLMSDVEQIKNAPVTKPVSVVTIVSYNGTYLLDTVDIVGSRPGDKANSEVFALWQQSQASGTARWSALARPSTAPVTIAIPAGTSVASVTNMDTRQAVSYSTSGQQVTFGVSDDPIEVRILPK